MAKNNIRIGGVPEHFNLPIQLGIEKQRFQNVGINADWETYNGGTGEMSLALRNNECDLCIVLTEGIITDIINGNLSKIISEYVKTPLIWGIHTGYASEISNLNSIFDLRIAISRVGSGSNLMPIVNALDKGKTILKEQFVNVKNMEGAIQSLNDGKSDVFYWEKFTAKPYVEAKKLRRIGEFISPWPCFVIAATEKIITERPELVDKTLKIIHAFCNDFMRADDAVEIVSQRFKLSKLDAGHWFHSTDWATDSWVSDKMLTSVLFTLKEAGIIPQTASIDKLVWKR